MNQLVATDLDGTLLNSNGRVSKSSLDLFYLLKELGIIRVIATGRSLYSLRKVIEDDFPVDYIVFSSGAGIIDWKNQEIIQKYNLTKEECQHAFNVLVKNEIDFSIQTKVPDNHFYKYVKFTKDNQDFDNRNMIYSGFCEEIEPSDFIPEESCQLLGIAEFSKGVKLYEKIQNELTGLKVIRSTSPLDYQSVWIEVYSPNTSKAKGIEIISNRHNIQRSQIMAIGNDYNDLDMLNWAERSFVVENSPTELRAKFQVVSSNENEGFSEAVNIWLTEKNL